MSSFFEDGRPPCSFGAEVIRSDLFKHEYLIALDLVCGSCVLVFPMRPVFRAVPAVILVALQSAFAMAAEHIAVEAIRPDWLGRPLTLLNCINLALTNNADILKSQRTLEAAHGLSVQTRAVAIPKLQVTADYGVTEKHAVDRLEIPSTPVLPAGISIDPGNQRWSASLRLVQTVFEGGRLRSALRTSKLLKDQAVAQHNALVADVITELRISYYDVLLAEQEVIVNEASVQLLQREFEDSKRKYDAGTVPRFNVLRAEVELANAKPRLSRARNDCRIAKTKLVHLLGYRLAADTPENWELRLLDTLDVPRLELSLSEALAKAIQQRPELELARKSELLRHEELVQARAGMYPRLQTYVGYGARKSTFASDIDREVHGWEAGVQLTWNIFDGALTRGKVIEAAALWERAQLEQEDLLRKIELEVRTAHSSLIEAWEVLQSQQKVVEQAEEALRLARTRADAGTGTQLDVLSAQTALTQARTTIIKAKHDYAVAKAKLERAIGAVSPAPELPQHASQATEPQ
ncbi:MAG: TolC family protein [Verrucomicrobiae bacterium]|nr:TolC family protein [Verrucomicrobiae bacterium]